MTRSSKQKKTQQNRRQSKQKLPSTNHDRNKSYHLMFKIREDLAFNHVCFTQKNKKIKVFIETNCPDVFIFCIFDSTVRVRVCMCERERVCD